MCVTSEVPIGHGLVQIKGVNTLARDMAALNPEGANQYMPGQRRDVTYVSRIQCKPELFMSTDLSKV